MPRIPLIAVVLFLFGGILSAPAAFAQNDAGTQDAMAQLESIESLALKRIEEGDYLRALELYRQYERLIPSAGCSYLQEDLLFNQAIAAYHAELYGEAMAYLKQFVILGESTEKRQVQQELRSVIEHRFYQKNPNMLFVRGESQDYVLWETYHQYSEAEVQYLLFGVWCVLFILLAVIYLSWNHKRFKRLLITAVVFAITIVLFLMVFAYRRFRTSSMMYAVVTSIDMLRNEPGENAPPPSDDGFIPGMTVMVVSQVPGWALVRRVDNVTAWIPNHDLYLLRGKGEQKSSAIEDVETSDGHSIPAGGNTAGTFRSLTNADNPQ